jgi:hypothetical protein
MAFGTGVGISSILATEEPILGVCGSYTTISNINLITHGLPQVVDVGLLQFDMFYDRGAQHNLYDKISVNLDRTHGNALGMYSKKTTSQGGIPGTNSMNTWRDISIKDCNYGFRILTGPNTGEGGNQLITSSCNTFNYIGDPNTPDDIISNLEQLWGLDYKENAAFIMRNCIVQNVTTTSTIAIQGVLIQGATNWCIYQISNNIIRNIKRINSQIIVDNAVDGMRVRWGNNLTGSFRHISITASAIS